MERPIIILLLILAIPFVYADECCTPLRESNQKMEFDEKEVFLVSDADWRTVLSLVPATTWTDETGSIITHPSLVFHEGITYNPFLTIGEFSWYLTVPAGAYQSFTPYSDFIHAIELRTWHESNPIALQLEDLSGRVIATSDTFFPETQGYHRFIFDVEVTSGATYNIVFLEENIQFYSYTDVYSGGKYSENSNYDINMRVYGRSTDTFDADSTMHFIQLYAPSKLTVIGDAPQELLNILTLPEGPTQEEIQQNPNLYQEGPGLDVEQIFQADPIDIFSFWNQYGGVVIVDYDNYKDGLMASVFASYFNMPLIFISTENMEDYVEVLTNRNVYTVGEIDTDVLVQAATLGRVAKTFTSEELRQEYLDLTDTDKIMLVNTNDMDNYMEDFRFPEKSTESLSQFFGDHSLAAPFLAAARQELIFDMADEGVTWSPAQPRCTPVPEIDNNVQLTEDKVDDLVENYLDYDVNYLTIVASPRAIPDSISYCSGEATRHQKDQDYGFKPNNLLDTSMTSYPELSINIDNDINVVFNKFIDGANQLFYSKLDGSDGSFITEPIQLTNVEDAINAAVRSNTDNEVFIVSQQTIEGNRDIYMTKISDDGIRIWPDDLLLSSFDGTVGQAPKIEIDADGNLHVIWMQSGGNSHLMYAKVNGADGTFMVSPTSLTETILPTLPKLDIDANGDVHIVWQYFYTGVDIYYIKLNGVDGSVMVEEMVISHDESGTSRTPDIKSDSEGDIHVIWQNYNLGETFYSIYYTKISGADGQTIIEPFQVSDNDDGRFHYLALSMDSEDNIHIVWDFELLGIKEILYAKINGETGEPMTQNTEITDNDAIFSSKPEIGIDTDDNLHMIFESGIGAGTLIQYSKFDLSTLERTVDEIDNVAEYDFSLGVGRIYGPTISDVSSYIARSLTYDTIIEEIYGTEYTGIALASSQIKANDYAKIIRDRTVDGGYDTLCYTTEGGSPSDPDGFRENCEHAYGPEPEEFDKFYKRQFITYDDHGSPSGWHTFSASPTSQYYMPWLDLSYSFGMACSTSNFWGSGNGQSLFASTFLKRGGIGYHGAVSVSSWIYCELPAIKGPTSRDMDFGQLNQELLLKTCPPVAMFTILLGDPVLKPHFKEVSWQ